MVGDRQSRQYLEICYKCKRSAAKIGSIESFAFLNSRVLSKLVFLEEPERQKHVKIEDRRKGRQNSSTVEDFDFSALSHVFEKDYFSLFLVS